MKLEVFICLYYEASVVVMPLLCDIFPFFPSGGLRTILTDQNKLAVAVGGLTALAAGIYTTR